MKTDNHLTAELRHALDDAGFLSLVEHYGGIRLYVPHRVDGSALAGDIGADHAAALVRRYAGDYLRVPLARAFRVRHYRAAGHSNAAIARKIGVTETAVNKLVRRRRLPAKGAQPDLFEPTS